MSFVSNLRKIFLFSSESKAQGGNLHSFYLVFIIAQIITCFIQSNLFFQLITDSYFAYDALEAIHRHPNKPYVYYFDHRGEITVADLVGDGKCCKNVGKIVFYSSTDNHLCM